MAYNNLEDFVNKLEKNNELHRIKTKVSSILEVSEINDRLIKNEGKALFFENVEGSDFPILVNAMGSKKRIEMAFGVNDIEDVAKSILSLFGSLTSPKETLIEKLKLLPQLKEISSWAPKRSSKKGNCQEIEMNNAKLLPFVRPILKATLTFIYAFGAYFPLAHISIPR